MPPLLLKARLIFPVDREPIENGIVEIENGRIVEVSERDRPGVTDLGNVALLPGLINAHTHLEFSDLSEPLTPSSPFTNWLRSVVRFRRSTPPDAASLGWGLAECAASGTVGIGEIATGNWSEPALRSGAKSTLLIEESGINPAPWPTIPTLVVAFHESLGLKHERALQELARARRFLEGPSTLPAADSDQTCLQLIKGLSPHAPYSVHPELFRQLCDLAVEFDAPVAMHLAETRGELQLLEQGTGEFVDFLHEMGVWEPQAIPRGAEICDYLAHLARARRGLVIHGNYLHAREQQFLAAHPQLTVVYCPRTHAYFGHAPHPCLDLLQQGVRVALGTDSRASNPDLSLWNEILFLCRQFPGIDPELPIRLGTLAGAEALGIHADYGTLTPGKLAAFCAIQLPVSEATNPYELVYGGTPIRKATVPAP